MNDILQKLVDLIKGLTFVNVAILAILLLLLIPAYFAYRVMNNVVLFAAVFSTYYEVDSPTECGVAFEQSTGGRPIWIIRATLSQRARETYTAAVRLDWGREAKPDEPTVARYCKTLLSVVDYARDPHNSPVPLFPESDRNLLPYPPPPHGEKDDGRPLGH